MNSPLLTREEAAQFLRISLRKLDDLASKGKIQYAKLDGRVLYREQDLVEYIERNLVDIPALASAARKNLC